MSVDAKKDSWPELIGSYAQRAVEIIKKELDLSGRSADKFQIVVLDQDAITTMDLHLKRIRIFKDESGTVVRTPHIG